MGKVLLSGQMFCYFIPKWSPTSFKAVKENLLMLTITWLKLTKMLSHLNLYKIKTAAYCLHMKQVCVKIKQTHCKMQFCFMSCKEGEISLHLKSSPLFLDKFSSSKNFLLFHSLISLIIKKSGFLVF